jgi:spore coat protein H
MKLRLLCLFVFITNSFIATANETIQINDNQYFIDYDKKIVLTNLDVHWINNTWTNSKTHVQLNEICTFSTPLNSVEIGTPYQILVPSLNEIFVLYFTKLPIISISTNFTIVDEPNVLAYFKMIETNQNFLESNIGIQYRGAWSQGLPKKSMEIEFWTDPTGDQTQNHSLLGMINDDDWNLQAMFNEPLRIRSVTNNELWRMINTLHYQNAEPEAINGIRMKYVELFINNEYRGIYGLGEKVNRKQLKLKNHNGNIRGELYKGVHWAEGANRFFALPPFDNNSLIWDGFEYKHPKEETHWTKLYNLVDFVINTNPIAFYNTYQNEFVIDNLVDYYIFLNLLRATDNTGKNLYIAKYNTNDKYFYVPWDLDGSFGTIWDGSNVNVTTGLLTNGLYNRLMFDCYENGFREKLKTKWQSLRTNIITHDNLMSLFNENHQILMENAVYERENLAWQSYTYNSSDLSYMSDWIENRLAFLDVKFTEDCVPLSNQEHIFNHGLFKIFPNPSQDLIHIKSNDVNHFKVTISNNLGQSVFTTNFSESENTLSLGHLKKGIYFIKLETTDYHEIHKIMMIN